MSARAKLNLNTLMVEAKALFKGIENTYQSRGRQLPFKWEDPIWDMIDYFGERAVEGRNSNNFLFARTHRHGRSKAPPDSFPHWFDDLAKALTVLRLHEHPNDGYGHVKCLPLVLRKLYTILERSRVTEPANILPQHFHDAVDLIEGDGRRRFQMASWLAWIADTLDAKGITPVPLMWRNPLNNPEYVVQDRRPDKAEIEMLAYCIQNPLDDEDNRDRIILNAIKLHVGWGGRGGETVSAPASSNLLIMEPRRSQPGAFNYAVRYDPEKGFHDGASIKPLDTICGEMSSEAYSELLRLCASARARAKVLEDNPGRCPIPKPGSDEFYAPDDVISLAELVPHLGMAIHVQEGRTETATTRKFIKRKYGVDPCHVPERGNGKTGTGPQREDPTKILYRVGDIESAILRRYRIELLPLKEPIARKLSECLCVVFERQLSGYRDTIPLIPRLMTTQDIRNALGAAPDAAYDENHISIFDRRGLKINDKRVKIIPHGSRHMKNTMLDEAGMSLLMQALAMGRKDPGQSEVYNHPDIRKVQANHLDRLRKLPIADQREALREWIRKGQAGGPVADRYQELFEEDPVRAEEFLQINTGHVLLTKYGGCLNDWSASEECPRHNKCYNNCKHLHVTGTGSEIAELEKDLEIQEMARTAILQQVQAGKHRATQALEARDREIAGIKKALEKAYVAKASREKSVEIERKDGGKFSIAIQVFPEGKDQYVPLRDGNQSEGA